MSFSPRGELLARSRLCPKCVSLFTLDYENPHRDNIDTLHESASQGCYICVRLSDYFERKGPEVDAAVTEHIFVGTELVGFRRVGTWDISVALYMKSWTVDRAAILKMKQKAGGEPDVIDQQTLSKRQLLTSWKKAIAPAKRLTSRLQQFKTRMAFKGATSLSDENSEAGSMTMHFIFFHALQEERAASMGLPTFISARTCSTQSMQQAESWIHHCCQNHVHCSRQKASARLPTRLIKIEFDHTSGFHARLCDSRFLPSDSSYLSLSHRWGEDNPTTLTTARLESFYRGISLTSLNRVFRDALEVTAALGYSYVWIDSLCIIQDDSDDWEREARLMRDVYRNAICNLAASEFESGDEGLLVNERCWSPMSARIQFEALSIQEEAEKIPRKPSALPRFTDEPAGLGMWHKIDKDLKAEFDMAHEITTDESASAESLSGKVFALMDEDPFRRIRAGSLFSRAWVLQEQILATRTLHFGKEQIFWECREMAANETWPQGFGNVSGRLDFNPFHASHDRETVKNHIFHFSIEEYSTKDPAEIHNIWKNIVYNYMKRDITFTSDRLLALDGIASEFTSLLKSDTYCCGLWMNDPCSLMWSETGSDEQRKARSEQAASPRPGSQESLPSWSWASQNQQVHFFLADGPGGRPPARIVTHMTELRDTLSPIGLRIQGPFLLLHPKEFSYREKCNYFISGEHKWACGSWAFQIIEGETKTSDVFLENPRRHEHLHVSREVVVEGLLYFVPMCQISVDPSPKLKEEHEPFQGLEWMPHRAPGLLLAKEDGHRGGYVRTGNAMLYSHEESLDNLFKHLQTDLAEDDYEEMEENGVCTLTLY